ncbi:hypothetical protein AB0L97_32885 [Nocardia sp. NPDC051911]|uniref:hypothetical protein n=1 Tax=Nocardia sp. NPDC051911 TaxID=3154648 RepID=UPI003430D607
MIDVDQIVRLHFVRLGPSTAAAREDATYNAQIRFMRNVVHRLGIVLEDEGIPDKTAERIVRGVLYGAPTEEAAELRMAQAANAALQRAAAMTMSERDARKAFGL